MSQAQAEATYWNGQPCGCERAIVIVADGDSPNYWARRFIGQERKVVLIHYNGATFAIDDEGFESTAEELDAFRKRFPDLPDGYYARKHGYPGWGWDKVTKGMGGPSVPHASVTYERIVSTEHDAAV